MPGYDFFLPGPVLQCWIKHCWVVQCVLAQCWAVHIWVVHCVVVQCNNDIVGLYSLLGTVLWPQQTVRSSCWSSMFNGSRPEPTNKRLNSAYLQIKFLIK